MARLPTPGSDDGTWGTILNEFLTVAHDDDGTLLAAADITDAKAKADTAVQSVNSKTGTAITLNAADVGALTQTTADGRYVQGKKQSTAPSSPAIDDLWYDSTNDVWKRWSGSAWVTGTGGSTPTTGDLLPDSGFATRRDGMQSIAFPIELGVARASTTTPVGTKPMVWAESFGQPGVLRKIWYAASGGSNDIDTFVESGGTIRIFLDSDTTPAVSMPINEFFGYGTRGGVYSNERIGRTARGGTGGGSSSGGDGVSGGYRYLYAPFEKYMRVEVENTTGADAVAVYGSADYTVYDAPLNTVGQKSFKIARAYEASHPKETPITIIDEDGAGNLESVIISLYSTNDNEFAGMEGNVLIYVDGETYPSWRTSGMEDFVNGAWYNIPVGGYPAGKVGEGGLGSGTTVSMYRFFVNDPIVFNSHIKVVVWIGQPGQGTWVGSTMTVAAQAGVWFDTPAAISYKAANTASPLLSDGLNYTGALSSSIWNQAGDRTQGHGTGSSITVAYTGTGSDADVRLARKGVTLPANYWVEAKLRVTEVTANGQEAGILAMSDNVDPYYGSAIHVTIAKQQQYQWVIQARDDFDTPFVTQIGNGADLTNVWLWVAVKVVGTRVTAYWKPDTTTAPWVPVGTWTSSKTGDVFGLSAWGAGVEYDQLNVYPLTDVTS